MISIIAREQNDLAVKIMLTKSNKTTKRKNDSYFSRPNTSLINFIASILLKAAQEDNQIKRSLVYRYPECTLQFFH